MAQRHRVVDDLESLRHAVGQGGAVAVDLKRQCPRGVSHLPLGQFPLRMRVQTGVVNPGYGRMVLEEIGHPCSAPSSWARIRMGRVAAPRAISQALKGLMTPPK